MKWLKWYLDCQKIALRKKKALYSWACTLSLCSVLCLIGVLLEAKYDKPIAVSTILAGFTHSPPAAANAQTPQ